MLTVSFVGIRSATGSRAGSDTAARNLECEPRASQCSETPAIAGMEIATHMMNERTERHTYAPTTQRTKGMDRISNRPDRPKHAEKGTNEMKILQSRSSFLSRTAPVLPRLPRRRGFGFVCGTGGASARAATGLRSLRCAPPKADLQAVDSADGLYICLISAHGLIRGENPELGRDADTGGQVLYVLELARALSRHPDVGRVELMTRQILSTNIAHEYGDHLEP